MGGSGDKGGESDICPKEFRGPRTGLGTRAEESMEQSGWLLPPKIREGLILESGNNSSGHQLRVDPATK